jgi:hypothetical protein
VPCGGGNRVRPAGPRRHDRNLPALPHNTGIPVSYRGGRGGASAVSRARWEKCCGGLIAPQPQKKGEITFPLMQVIGNARVMLPGQLLCLFKYSNSKPTR